MKAVTILAMSLVAAAAPTAKPPSPLKVTATTRAAIAAVSVAVTLMGPGAVTVALAMWASTVLRMSIKATLTRSGLRPGRRLLNLAVEVESAWTPTAPPAVIVAPSTRASTVSRALLITTVPTALRSFVLCARTVTLTAVTLGATLDMGPCVAAGVGPGEVAVESDSIGPGDAEGHGERGVEDSVEAVFGGHCDVASRRVDGGAVDECQGPAARRQPIDAVGDLGSGRLHVDRGRCRLTPNQGISVQQPGDAIAQRIGELCEPGVDEGLDADVAETVEYGLRLNVQRGADRVQRGRGRETDPADRQSQAADETVDLLA